MEGLRFWLAIAAASGFLAVALGAFATHGLQARMSAEQAAWFATALRYHMFHVGGLLAVALLAAPLAQVQVAGTGGGGITPLALAGWGFLLGTLVFSGLLYAMALGAPRWLGALVPLGGLAFLGGWASLLLLALRRFGPG